MTLGNQIKNQKFHIITSLVYLKPKHCAVMAISVDLPVTPVLTSTNNSLSRGQEVIPIIGLTDSSVSVEKS